MTQTILVDSAQKQGYHPEIEDIRSMGYDILRMPLAVGDYAVMSEEVGYLKEIKERQIQYLAKKGKVKELEFSKIDNAGTYKLAVDTKANMEELYYNLVSDDRFRFECELQRAWNHGVLLLVLITTPEYQSEQELKKYEHHYTNRQGITNHNVNAGKAMVKAMRHLEEIYPVLFQFCDADKAATEIINFLKADFKS